MKDKTSPDSKDPYIKLKLRTFMRTDEAYLVDLGAGKVWIPVDAIKSTRRVDQGILSIEVKESVIREKRRELRRIKEELTGLKGSVRGEVVELTGKLLEESPHACLIKLGAKEIFMPRVCFAELEKLPDGNYRFVLEKNFLEFKLKQKHPERPEAGEETTTARVEILQETDRAYFLGCQEVSFWYPKREVIEIKPAGEKWDIVVPLDFWRFKLENCVS